MLNLPLELQIILSENITELDSLVALYDSLPSTSSTFKNLLVNRILVTLRAERAHRLETLIQCRAAVFELRDVLGVESLLPKFTALAQGLEKEIRMAERPVEFRGLAHCSQTQTFFKKSNMREQQGSTSPKGYSRRQRENFTKESATRDILEDDSSEHLWLRRDGKVCLSTFMDNLYSQQLTDLT